MARLRSVKLDREDPGGGLSVWAAKMPWRGKRGTGARGNTSASSSFEISSLSNECDDTDVLLEMFALWTEAGFSWPLCPCAMNSHDGAVWGALVDGEKGLLVGGKPMVGGRKVGALVGGISGDEPRVVPEPNEGTGDASAG